MMKEKLLTNKKKIIVLIIAMFVAIIATINVNINSNRQVLSDMFLANVEALAKNEYGTCVICGQTSCDCYGNSDWCSISCYYSPGRCWFKVLPYYWEDCQPSGILTDYCEC